MSAEQEHNPAYKAYATAALCIIITILFIFDSITNGFLATLCSLHIPFDLSTGWYTLITDMFIHANIFHFICNLVSLFGLGVWVESKSGSVRMLITFFLSGIIGNLTAIGYYSLTGVETNLLGASGAIFGLLGMYSVYLVRDYKMSKAVISISHGAKIAQAYSSLMRKQVIELVEILVINLAVGFIPGVAMSAHIGGLVTGILLNLKFAPVKTIYHAHFIYEPWSFKKKNSLPEIYNKKKTSN